MKENNQDDYSRLYSEVILSNLSFEQAKEFANIKESTFAITRPEWRGFHFIIGEDYYILLKDRKLMKIENDDDIWNKDSKDWIIVIPSEEAIKIIKDKKLI